MSPERASGRTSRGKITAPAIVEMMRRGEPITVVTAYDFPTARLADQAVDEDRRARRQWSHQAQHHVSRHSLHLRSLSMMPIASSAEPWRDIRRP